MSQIPVTQASIIEHFQQGIDKLIRIEHDQSWKIRKLVCLLERSYISNVILQHRTSLPQHMKVEPLNQIVEREYTRYKAGGLTMFDYSFIGSDISELV